jgi:CheY-like chemotaxis protein
MRIPFSTVLLIDDEPIANFLHEIVIRQVGIGQEVLIFQQASRALDYLLATFPPATPPSVLIFLDINMPLMDGFDFLEELQRKGYSALLASIVILSSSTHPIDQQKAKQYGIKYYLSKPLTQSILQDFIRRNYL